eukprot:TRINITY_DN2853_c0_g3_i1.p1 TRINITY_DN2853_c0_g3~~TRINITY_DN2853_c0_g3_i1.p1  ORF type:complete len:347 (+),score=52.63 TRINITY_DN2853_c0_g3_i1:44-1042(+)
MEQEDWMIAGYTKVRKLARGGQATVYKASAGRGDAEHVAVKLFHQSASANAACQSELRLLTTVQGHRHIARLVDVVEPQGGPYALVLELYARDLSKLVLKRRLREAKAVAIIRGVLSALEHVHSLDIIHRDVKPENVAIGGDGEARLIDFGVATSIHNKENMLMFPHSPGYAAPELLERKPYGFPVDMFGLGATFYFALSQELAFATLDMKNESIIAKTKKCVVSFGEKFDRVTSGTQNAIRWLMHETAKWRPKASDALSSAPFAVPLNVQSEEEAVNVASEESRPQAVHFEARAPTQARERPARPAPRARFRVQRDDEYFQAPAASSAQAV